MVVVGGDRGDPESVEDLRDRLGRRGQSPFTSFLRKITVSNPQESDSRAVHLEATQKGSPRKWLWSLEPGCLGVKVCPRCVTRTK